MATHVVDPQVFNQIKNLGAFDVSACMSCGLCTVSCPLSVSGNEFPRKLIRYAMLGLEDKLLSHQEPWLCYYCGDCTDSCPSEADPGGFMMALRRHAIIGYSVGKIAKLFYSKKLALISYSILTLFAMIGLWLFTADSELNLDTFESYSYLGHEIHLIGLLFGFFIALIAMIHAVNIYSHLKSNNKSNSNVSFSTKVIAFFKSFISVGLSEGLIERRYFECESKNRWLAHMAIFWGFILMGIATSIIFIADMIIEYNILGSESGTIVNRELIKYLGKILGVSGGLLLLLGTGYYIYLRLAKKEAYSKQTHFSDWIFILLIFFIGLNGMIMDVIIYFFNELLVIAYWMYALHLILVFILIITAAFTKFIHMEYRLLSIWYTEYQKLISPSE